MAPALLHSRPDVQHWFLLKMQKRVETFGQPLNEIYAVEYPARQLPHSFRPYQVCKSAEESFELMAGIVFTIAGNSYLALMTAIIDEFKVYKHDAKIKVRMR